MSRDPQYLLDDILESGQVIREYIEGETWEGFLANRQKVDATIRRFEIIGEAVKGLPDEWKRQEPEVEWKAIAGFRDVLIHAYFEVDSSIVWNAATEPLPQLLEACERLKK